MKYIFGTKNYKKQDFQRKVFLDFQFYIINQQNWEKKGKLHIDPKSSPQSLSGSINKNVYVWNLFIPKDRALAFENDW